MCHGIYMQCPNCRSLSTRITHRCPLADGRCNPTYQGQELQRQPCRTCQDAAAPRPRLSGLDQITAAASFLRARENNKMRTARQNRERQLNERDHRPIHSDTANYQRNMEANRQHSLIRPCIDESMRRSESRHRGESVSDRSVERGRSFNYHPPSARRPDNIATTTTTTTTTTTAAAAAATTTTTTTTDNNRTSASQAGSGRRRSTTGRDGERRSESSHRNEQANSSSGFGRAFSALMGRRSSATSNPQEAHQDPPRSRTSHSRRASVSSRHEEPRREPSRSRREPSRSRYEEPRHNTRDPHPTTPRSSGSDAPRPTAPESIPSSSRRTHNPNFVPPTLRRQNAMPPRQRHLPDDGVALDDDVRSSSSSSDSDKDEEEKEHPRNTEPHDRRHRRDDDRDDPSGASGRGQSGNGPSTDGPGSSRNGGSGSAATALRTSRVMGPGYIRRLGDGEQGPASAPLWTPEQFKEAHNELLRKTNQTNKLHAELMAHPNSSDHKTMVDPNAIREFKLKAKSLKNAFNTSVQETRDLKRTYQTALQAFKDAQATKPEAQQIQQAKDTQVNEGATKAHETTQAEDTRSARRDAKAKKDEKSRKAEEAREAAKLSQTNLNDRLAAIAAKKLEAEARKQAAQEKVRKTEKRLAAIRQKREEKDMKRLQEREQNERKAHQLAVEAAKKRQLAAEAAEKSQQEAEKATAEAAEKAAAEAAEAAEKKRQEEEAAKKKRLAAEKLAAQKLAEQKAAEQKRLQEEAAKADRQRLAAEKLAVEQKAIQDAIEAADKTRLQQESDRMMAEELASKNLADEISGQNEDFANTDVDPSLQDIRHMKSKARETMQQLLSENLKTAIAEQTESPVEKAGTPFQETEVSVGKSEAPVETPETPVQQLETSEAQEPASVKPVETRTPEEIAAAKKNHQQAKRRQRKERKEKLKVQAAAMKAAEESKGSFGAAVEEKVKSKGQVQKAKEHFKKNKKVEAKAETEKIAVNKAEIKEVESKAEAIVLVSAITEKPVLTSPIKTEPVLPAPAKDEPKQAIELLKSPQAETSVQEKPTIIVSSPVPFGKSPRNEAFRNEAARQARQATEAAWHVMQQKVIARPGSKAKQWTPAEKAEHARAKEEMAIKVKAAAEKAREKEEEEKAEKTRVAAEKAKYKDAQAALFHGLKTVAPNKADLEDIRKALSGVDEKIEKLVAGPLSLSAKVDTQTSALTPRHRRHSVVEKFNKANPPPAKGPEFLDAVVGAIAQDRHLALSVNAWYNVDDPAFDQYDTDSYTDPRIVPQPDSASDSSVSDEDFVDPNATNIRPVTPAGFHSVQEPRYNPVIVTTAGLSREDYGAMNMRFAVEFLGPPPALPEVIQSPSDETLDYTYAEVDTEKTNTTTTAGNRRNSHSSDSSSDSDSPSSPKSDISNPDTASKYQAAELAATEKKLAVKTKLTEIEERQRERVRRIIGRTSTSEAAAGALQHLKSRLDLQKQSAELADKSSREALARRVELEKKAIEEGAEEERMFRDENFIYTTDYAEHVTVTLEEDDVATLTTYARAPTSENGVAMNGEDWVATGPSKEGYRYWLQAKAVRILTGLDDLFVPETKGEPAESCVNESKVE